ncbi:MAG: tRNA (N(6)-L-threonylcarbamoyladenosine(37)-C(2))-methylthiotransferase MtaB [Paramuribaculum sp.]|nr:tRNA (N(6)-L-threonylcarbamoyladenosine(37)-C(2))-methylthiotransferase MtaB [Paramuribaculum sp.]
MTDPELFSTPKALFHTFGCKLNFAETSSIARRLAERGIMRVQKGEIPDIIVVNTCSVTELADKKCRQAIRNFSRRYPEAAIMLTGCYAQLKPEEAAALPGVAIVTGTDSKMKLPELIEQWLRDRKKLTFNVKAKDIDQFEPSCSYGDRTRRFLKVQDGCDYWCSYCTIPMARGRSRSGKIEEITAQARKAAAEGAKEIVLTGVNIGDFGKGTDETFYDLIRRLDDIEGIERYRISSIEPNLLTPEIIEFTASSRAFMPHFHIPLQSGSDRVLTLMRRRYDTSLFKERIEQIRALMPDAFIGVDIIAGSRGETDEEFEKSYDFCKGLDITKLHVFPYSERPGTKALDLQETVVPQEEKHRRVNRLLRLSEEKSLRFATKFIGTVRPVLMEHTEHGGKIFGFTDNYLKVSLAADANLFNKIIPVKLSELSSDSESIIGTML